MTVTIDRELLGRCSARLHGLMQADLSTELEAILAQPIKAGAAWQRAQSLSVPDEKPLPDLMMSSYHEAIGWNACRKAMLASAPAHPAERQEQGEVQRLLEALTMFVHLAESRLQELGSLSPEMDKCLSVGRDALAASTGQEVG